eukprot:CCRYP_014133-RA/>CCRYP_014133-RA protein AED:0.02 eAED:0.02 QI:68/1/1/1/1/1/6/174/3100
MEQTKSFNNRGGKNRLRFTSSKSRAKRASADIYRANIGNHLSSASSTAVREKRVHDGSSGDGGGSKRRKSKKLKPGTEEDATVRFFDRDNDAEGFGIGRTAVIVKAAPHQDDKCTSNPRERDEVRDGFHEEHEEKEAAKLLLTGGTEFLTEIELSAQRNGSQLFQRLVWELRPLCRSFAELLHHKKTIIDLLCANLLSDEIGTSGFIANVSTNDVLHLLGVLARELRSEMYPFLQTKILPRIIDDMLNPPQVTGAGESSERQHQRTPMDVAHIEAAFRCISYLFKYNSEQLVNSQDPSVTEDVKGKQQQSKRGDADILRQYYGRTICHKRDIVRKLACEAFAPLLRKCTEKGLQRHLMRTVKALATSSANAQTSDDNSNHDKDGSNTNMTNNMKRALNDAIDGVSSLFFEVARGAKKVHSKTGHLVIRSLMDCLVGYSSNCAQKSNDTKIIFMETYKADVVYEVASQFLYKLRGHIVRGTPIEEIIIDSSLERVFDEIHQALDTAVSLLKEADLSSGIQASVVGHIVDMIAEMVRFQEGRLIRGTDSKHTESDRIINSLQTLLSTDVYTRAGKKLETQILQYLSAAWKVNPSHPSFSLRLGKFFPRIVSPNSNDKDKLRPAIFLARKMLPYLPQKVASESLVPSLLSAAALCIGKEETVPDGSLVLLHTISTATWPAHESQECDVDADDVAADSFFSVASALQLPVIPSKVRHSLIDLCLSDDLKESTSKSSPSGMERLARIGYAVRCLPFLVCLECSGDDSDADVDETGSTTHDKLTKLLKWFVSIVKHLDTGVKNQSYGIDESVHVVQALVIESFSKVAIECHNRDQSSTIQAALLKTATKVKSSANSLLSMHPKSCWAIKGVAALTTSLTVIEPGSVLNERSNETFELLMPNLSETDHFLRLYTLQILDSYPKRPFVTDHADLDLTDDLEEEPSYDTGDAYEGNETTMRSELAGQCDVISLLKTIEATPIAFANERKLTSHIGRVEVYAATGKLPALYAESAVSHMLGLLHVKFSPIWPAAVRVIVALTTSQEGSTWPCVYSALQKSMEKPAPDFASSILERNSLSPKLEQYDLVHTKTLVNHHNHCVAWERSNGTYDMFESQDRAEGQVVPRYARADDLSFFENLWSIMTSAQHLTTTKSKMVVPLFFEFMAYQYYVFHSDDPDIFEINLPDIVDSRCTWSHHELGRKSVQTKFECFLKMFAAVKGPQQLFKHHQLLRMFIGFLSNADTKVANLAFLCVQTYKPSYLVPYIDFVKQMLKKDELRDALAKFDLSVNSDSVDPEHRLSLIPIVTRILFGRLASRGSGSKSSRDSPAARRAAILSFFSRMGNLQGELTYFVYMMVRAFIPPGNMSHQVDHQNINLVKSIESLNSITSRDVIRVPIPKQVGFLNLLSDVISQIGFGVDHVVPVYMNLLLAMCEEAQDALVASAEHNTSKTYVFHDEESSTHNNENSQVGRIRTLTFLRMGELLTKFASSVDFSVYGNRFWKATSCSLLALPNTVINAENPPSLLRLIESISADSKLLTMLNQSKDVIPAVAKCIAGTTRLKVMNCVLRIIGNLLAGGGTAAKNTQRIDREGIGQSLILEHIHLLIAQFNERYTSKIAKCDNGDNINDYSDKGHTLKSTEGLQLDILCRVSELLLADSSTVDEHIKTMDNLCGLLVPSLKFDTHPNQLHLLRTVANFIPRVSAESAKSHYHALSKLLGPNKSGAGISSNEMRQIITTALCAIGCRSPNLQKVTEATRDLNAFSTSHVDEYDFKRMLPVLNSLGAPSTTKGSWLDLSALKDGNSGDPRALLPLLYSCLHMLYSPDAVVGRASNKALKSLITICSEQVKDESHQPKTSDLSHNPWVQFVEKTVVPCLKTGLMTKIDDSRRYFVLLISHVARSFSGYKSPHLYGDLSALIRDDDQDLDFFLNVTHLQLHRRVKALQRLRKMISTTDVIPHFSQQSYGNVLLPLAIHPVYEYKSKSEDIFVVEAIATAGAISSHLTWGKYHGALQSVLNSLARHPEKERYLVSLLCTMIDAFHFSVEADSNGLVGVLPTKIEGNGVWRSLKNRIIPKVETFLVKEKTDSSGTKTKSIRASVVLALVKLFQKLPNHTFEEKLPQLIKVISSALRNRDSNERDIARGTMAKIASSLDMKYLPLILSDLSVSLSFGYQLHVRAATLHSILVAISGVYQPQTVNSIDEALSASFDRCVPAMLDLIQQDIFGISSEMKEVEHVEKRMIKEAMGSKSQDSLEIISRLIIFKPSMATNVENRNKSAAHVLVSPFIERLMDSEVSPPIIRKVKECLSRIAFGLSNNPSANIHEILPFIYATISPFVLGEERKSSDLDLELENSDDEVETPLEISKSDGTRGDKGREKKTKGTVVRVSSWAPSTLGSEENQRSALDSKRHQHRDLHKVRDGITAPKLTGSLRQNPIKNSPARSLNNPAHASALIFGLTMLNSCLKRSKLDVSDEIICSMADPYLHLLLEYVRCSQDNNGVVLSLRCLGSLLQINLPSVSAIAKELSPMILGHLTKWGAASNTQTDIVQGCFKTLTLLFLHPKVSSPEHSKSTDASCNLPLTSHQMQALISLLHSAVMESEHHNATFGLVKAICSVKYISYELYDLMEIILKLSVQSQKPSVRLQSSQIFLQYLLDYPMGTQRLDNHLRQIVLNLKYEYEEGRLSAIDLLSSVIQKLPVPVLENHSQLFFLPLVLQLANDDSKKCKEAVTKAISILLTRMSTDILESFFSYVNRWYQSSGEDAFCMRQAASQLFGIFIESRPDYIKRGPTSTAIISAVTNAVQSYIPFGDDSGWELLYYNLVCIEKLNKEMWSTIFTNIEIGSSLVKLMAYPHPWIMQVSLRIINNHLSSIDPNHLLEQGADSYIVKTPNCLYNITRNLCRQLDVDDTHYVETLSTLAIKSVTWVFEAMNHHPQLFYTNTTGSDHEEESEQLKSPCRWIMTRLANIAKPKFGDKRRESIFKCFATLCASCGPELLTPYLRLMIDSLDRAIREETNNLKSDEQQVTHPLIALPKDVLNLLEDVCGTEKFLEAYSDVNKKVRQKRDQRKQDIAAEAIHDPASAAKRKIKKQLQEKERKKRRVNDMKAMRGAFKKKPS